LGINYKEIELEGIYRVKGGKVYHQFVEDLLGGRNVHLPRLENYEIRIFTEIEKLLEELRTKVNSGYRVALVAAFTESPGDREDRTSKSIDNRRIGYPLKSGFDRYKDKNLDIYWLMDEKNQYPSFWYKGESNNLTHCASIYGCQGFEADYVGVIWGRDFVWRNGKWSIGLACEDTVGKPSLKELIEKRNERAIPLLINRYRIFLTRGILGTYIYCEDDETEQYLKGIISMNEIKFATAINCIDGRVQIPVIEWLKKEYGVNYVDMITEPGPDKVLSENKNDFTLQEIKRKVEISISKHASKLVAIVGHHNCAGNPVEKETHLKQISSAIETIKMWNLDIDIIGLWVDENWKVHKVE